MIFVGAVFPLPPPGSWESTEPPPPSSYAVNTHGHLGKGKEGTRGERADSRGLSLTNPSHQGGQDLQVLGLLDVKEGEGSKEESEDSLGDRNKYEGCRGWAHVAHRTRVGEDALSTRPLPLAAGPNHGVHLGHWRRLPGGQQQHEGSSPGCDINPEPCSGAVPHASCPETNFWASPRQHPRDIACYFSSANAQGSRPHTQLGTSPDEV